MWLCVWIVLLLGGRWGCRGVLGQEREVACNTKKLHATTCYCNAKNATTVIAIIAPHSIPAGKIVLNPRLFWDVAKAKNATTRNCTLNNKMRCAIAAGEY